MTTEETYIETGLQILDEKETALQELATKYNGLTVDGIEDKEGLEIVRRARITLKNERVAIETIAKELRDPAIRWQKKVIEREKKLIAIIEPLEEELKAEEKRIEVLKEEARQQKEMMEAKVLQDRFDALAQYNFAADWVEVKHMTDDQFDEMIAHAKNLHEEELNRQAEIKAEEERARKEEAERMQREREEFERQKAEQSRLNSRIQKVIKLGYQWCEKYENYQLEVGTLSGVIGLQELKAYSDEEFESFYSESVFGFTRERERLKKLDDEKRAEQVAREAAALTEIGRARAEQHARERELQQQEQERIEAERKRQEAIRKEEEERQSAIRAEREVYERDLRRLEDERRAIEEEKRKHEEDLRLEQAKKESAERARIEEQARIKREAEEKTERERLAKLEAERQESLKPDKQRLLDYVDRIVTLANDFPKFNHAATCDLSEDIGVKLQSVANIALEKIDEL
jgi:hypothetical protein